MPRWWKPPTKAQAKRKSKGLSNSVKCLRYAEMVAHRTAPNGDRSGTGPEDPRNRKFYKAWAEAYDRCVKDPKAVLRNR